ncbi:MAG: long-chain fatty acid--CoA ligase, partial [Duncaniella sp.]|nr:long-chain fatty acid--CoA ligase [Duncaniella sp.]
IAPQALEMRLEEDKYIDQIAVIGDRRKFVSALIVPDYNALKDFAAKENITYHSMDELVRNTRVCEMMALRIEKLQKGLASYEKVKRFTILPRPFSMENGELTNTLKVKRHAVNRIYAKEIDAMYKA